MTLHGSNDGSKVRDRSIGSTRRENRTDPTNGKKAQDKQNMAIVFWARHMRNIPAAPANAKMALPNKPAAIKGPDVLRKAP